MDSLDPKLLRRFLEQATEVNADAIYFIDEAGRFVHVNDTACDALGYSQDELRALSVTDVDPSFPAVAWPNHWASLRASRSLIFETLHRRKDGQTFPVEVRAHLLAIDGIELNCAFVRDITERKRAELIRTRTKKRLDLFIELERKAASLSEREIAQEGLETAVSITESAIGYFHFVDDDQENLSLFTWSGRAMAECTAANPAHYPLSAAGIWADCVRTRAPAVHNDFLSEAARKGYPEGHSPVKRHMSVPVFDGDRIRMILGVGNKTAPYDDLDIRELQMIGREIWALMGRHRINRVLRDSEEQFRTLFERAPEGILIMTMQGKVVRANPAFAAMHGLSVEEITRMKIEDLDVLGDATFSEDDPRIKRQLEGEVLRFEVEHKHRDGHVFPLAVLTSLIAIAGEQFIIAFHRDLTEERRLESRIREKEKMAAVGELAAGIAHEFNNIMSTPSMVAETLLIDRAEGKLALSPSHADRLKDIIASVNRGRTIVGNLLTFARPRYRDGQPVDVVALVDDVLGEMAAELRDARIDVRCLHGASRSVIGDQGQLAQVLRNLVSNALHAMLPHGRGRLEVSTNDEEAGIALCVRDDGAGVVPGTESRLFSPFFTTKGAFAQDTLGIPGTGLGLAVSLSIVRAHGGDIRFEHAPDGGSVFTVLLPALPQAERPMPRPALGPSSLALSGLRALVIDDEAPLRRTMADLLKSLGAARVETATSSEQGLAIVASSGDDLDVVLLDWMMPGDGGAVVLDRLRDSRPDLPVIVISGKLGLEESGEVDARAAGILGKPFSIEKLARLIQSACPGRLEAN